MSYENISLHVNDAEHRFEITVEDTKAFIDFKQAGSKIFLIHTEVAPEMQSKGVAAALVEKTFVYLEDNTLQLVPICSYVEKLFKKPS